MDKTEYAIALLCQVKENMSETEQSDFLKKLIKRIKGNRDKEYIYILFNK